MAEEQINYDLEGVDEAEKRKRLFNKLRSSFRKLLLLGILSTASCQALLSGTSDGEGIPTEVPEDKKTTITTVEIIDLGQGAQVQRYSVDGLRFSGFDSGSYSDARAFEYSTEYQVEAILPEDASVEITTIQTDTTKTMVFSLVIPSKNEHQILEIVIFPIQEHGDSYTDSHVRMGRSIGSNIRIDLTYKGMLEMQYPSS